MGDARSGSGTLPCRSIFDRASLAVLALVLVLGVARVSVAQLPAAILPLSNVEDARTLPKGTVRLRALNAWTRIDEVYDAAADSAHRLHPLGDAFSASQLGVRQLPALAETEAKLRALTGDPTLSLNVGQAFATADSRIVTTPLSLEYGLTNRLTIGATVPIVQTHTTLFVELNPRRLGPAFAGVNVGPRPVAASNGPLLSALDAAVQQLRDFVNTCNSGGTCSPGTLDEANYALAQNALVRDAANTLYGAGSGVGSFAPFGAAQAAAVAHLKGLQDTTNAVLGSSYSFAAPAGAAAPAALLQLQQLATARAGVAYDSLGSSDRLSIGDVELSAVLKLLDEFGDTTRNAAVRGAVRGVMRLGTGWPSFGTVPFEVGTGTRQTSVDAGGIFDVRFTRRFMTTLAAQYTAYLTHANVDRLPNGDYSLFPLTAPIPGTWREGNALQIEATPRVLLSDYFTLHGAYALRRQAAPEYAAADGSAPPAFEATIEQRVGLGFAYSTLARYARGRASVPFEIFFTHLETITGSGGLTPKYHRDQIDFRIYYRLRRPR
jgi:hypothetical protein